jgi:hypothetical protein
MSESDQSDESGRTENLAYLEGRWATEGVKGFLDTPSYVDPHDRAAVAAWLLQLSETLAESDAIVIVQQDDPTLPDPPPEGGVYVEIAFAPTIRLCPGKMPGVPWDRSDAVENDQLAQWKAYKELYPTQVAG